MRSAIDPGNSNVIAARRSPDKAQNLNERGIDSVIFDLNDAKNITNALKDGVFKHQIAQKLPLEEHKMSTVEKETTAQESAQKWLDLIDRSQYSDSWSQAAPYFKHNVTQAQWQRTLLGVRQPLGKMLSREVASMQYTTTLPGSPDSEYVVVQYNTSFENKQSAIETVTPMLNSDGAWQVAGYYIR